MFNENSKFARFELVPTYAALMCLSYMASLFLVFSFIVMPGLATIDDHAFVAAFQGLEARFQSTGSQYENIPTIIALPGSCLFIVAAAAMHREKTSRLWLLAALAFFVVGMIITLIYNLPANSVIFTAGDPYLIDVTQVRQNFDEVSWTNWNHFRAAAFSCAFLCVLRTLHLSKGPV